MPTLLAFDTETELLSQKSINPRIICFSIATQTGTELVPDLFANGDQDFNAALDYLVQDPNLLIVTLKGAYDFACLATTRPDLIPAIFKLYEDGRVVDVILREKLMNLSTTGKLEKIEITDANGKVFTKHLNYSMAALAEKYFGIDMSAVKGDEDSWRLRYHELDGKKKEEYPPEAARYAMDDALMTLAIYNAQERFLQSFVDGPNSGAEVKPSVVTQEFQAAADFALYMISTRGFEIDFEKKAVIEKELINELSPEKLCILYETGIVRRGSPPMPYANGAKNEDGTPKMKAAVPDSVDTKKLKALVEEVCIKNGIKIKRTDTGLISTDSEVLDDVSHLHPVLERYAHRQSLQKLVSTEMPRLSAKRIYPIFNALVSSGRTSSYANKKKGGQEPLYASFNCQNVDPRARGCYKADDGYVMCSCDYKSLELVSFAQQLYNLYKEGRISYPSKLREQINRGWDVHSYLGGQLAYAFHDEFRNLCQSAGLANEDDIYKLFNEFKKAPKGSDDRNFFDLYRKWAKVTGLGYPGGLGPGTMVGYSKKTFGLIITEEQARKMREVWFKVYPEHRQYLQVYINTLAKGEEYSYTSPLGMKRVGCSYCDAANGRGLQTPSAEGAKLAVFNAVRACLDSSIGNKWLYLQAFILAFIHDELVAILKDDGFAHERAMEIKKIMVDSMSRAFPDMLIEATPVLFYYWKKDVDPKYDERGRLVAA